MGKREEREAREKEEDKAAWAIAFRIRPIREVNMKIKVRYPRAHYSLCKFPNYICACCTDPLLVGVPIRFETTAPNVSKVKTYWCEDCYQTK